MPNSQPGLLGLKVGMTHIYTDKGEQIPVTVVETGKNAILAVKTADSADGYNAVKLGIGERKSSQTNQPLKGEYDKVGVAPKQHVREIRVSAEYAAGLEAGGTLGAGDAFNEGDMVDVTGTSKGRGFAGVMKKFNFAGFIRSHGTHEFFRHGGSIGTRLTPGHVLKGKKMPGHHGAARVTVQNLEIVKVDADKDLLFIRGGVPGANGGLVSVRKAVKLNG